MKKKMMMAAVVAAALLALVVYGWIRANRQSSTVLTTEQLEETGNETASSEIVVHVAGAVINPGVYTLKPNARVIDAIEAAGGVTEEANTDVLNLAAAVSDGEKIQVYTDADLSDSVSGNTGGLININTASKEALMSLSGIGEVLAENIIRYREEHGGFRTKEELKEVNRIGDKLYEQIEGSITI